MQQLSGSGAVNISSYQTGPAGDANFLVQHRGEEDDEQQGEEEGRAAYKLEEVERSTADAAVHHLLQDEGHEGQKLAEGERRQEQNQVPTTSSVKTNVSSQVKTPAQCQRDGGSKGTTSRFYFTLKPFKTLI